MTVAISALGAVLPSVLLLWFFYKRDLNPEPRAVLVKTFLLGVLAIIPVGVIALPIVLAEPTQASYLLVGLYSAFLGAAIPEELCKFLVVKWYSARHTAFDEPMDGVVYGATASLGFATLENILYVGMGDWTTALVRAFTAVPSHAFGGAILGYYIGQARFNSNARVSAWQGFWVAMLLHGLYDFGLLSIAAMDDQGLLTEGDDMPTGRALSILALLGLVLVVMAVEVIWVWRILRRLRAEQVQLAAQLALPVAN